MAISARVWNSLNPDLLGLICVGLIFGLLIFGFDRNSDSLIVSFLSGPARGRVMHSSGLLEL
jgi:hypothetical protein